ncbi:MAG: carbon-nitrogen hydrolase family protein [Bacillota bacterium]
MERPVRISVCQMTVENNKESNIEKAVGMIGTSAENHADMVLLPEMFNCPYENSKFVEFAESQDDGPTIKALSNAAKENGVYIIAGSIPEIEEGKIYNSSFIFDSEGKIIGRHRKIHLFDINIPGKISFKESDTLTAGNETTVIDTGFCKIGVAICYDVRFPEIFRLMALKGAKLVIVPAAFNMTTGPLHWELLMRARAVDNQVFMAAVSPARNVKASYVAYGNSMVVDPWANILVRADGEENILYSDIQLSQVDKVRRELPLLAHRRNDIY